MNRMEEYYNLMQELEQPVPELEHTFDRAHRKVVRRKRVIRSVANIAAVFIIFVGLVNFSEPIATTCSKLPILRELAEAVTFSDSLSDAVANEYVQMLSLSQTDNDITASVEYLIVDKKQVTVFFRLNSVAHIDILAHPIILSANGEADKLCSCDLNNWNMPNGELESITIDFFDRDVPESLLLELNIRDGNVFTPVDIRNDMTMNEEPEESESLVTFTFLLEFDPELSAKPKVYSINQTFFPDGKEITFTDIEIYPSHLRLNTTDSSDNAEFLAELFFYVKTEDGKKFDSPSVGPFASGINNSIENTSIMSFRTDSPYFYDSDEFEIVITGGRWHNKENLSIYREWKAEEPIRIFVK